MLKSNSDSCLSQIIISKQVNRQSLMPLINSVFYCAVTKRATVGYFEQAIEVLIFLNH